MKAILDVSLNNEELCTSHTHYFITIIITACTVVQAVI